MNQPKGASSECDLIFHPLETTKRNMKFMCQVEWNNVAKMGEVKCLQQGIEASTQTDKDNRVTKCRHATNSVSQLELEVRRKKQRPNSARIWTDTSTVSHAYNRPVVHKMIERNKYSYSMSISSV